MDVLGPRVASLDGIERMTALRELTLEGVRSPDLSPVERLNLERLVVHHASGAVDYRPIEALSSLASLAIVADIDHGPAIAALDLSRLVRLEVLELVVEGGRFEIDPAWLPLPRLERLTLEGVMLTDSALERVVEHRGSLDALVFQPRSSGQLRMARRGMPGCLVMPADEGAARLGSVVAHERDGRPEFSLGLDLAEVLGVDTNYDAEGLLRDELRRRHFDDDVGFDTEAGAVWIVSARREPLERVRQVVADLTAGRRGDPAPPGG